MITALAVALIVLAVIDWWCVGLLWIIALRNPEVRILRAELERSLLTTTAATLIAILAGNFLLDSPLPKGAGFVLLSLSVVMVSLPLVHFLVTFYRRRP